MSDYLKDNAYEGCLYCESITKNSLGGRLACIFHTKNKNREQGFEFWSAIRSMKPKNYDGFIFPNFQQYHYDDNKRLLEDANFWLAGQQVQFDREVIFQNCIFGDVFFNKVEFNREIIFIGCTINKLWFYHVNFAQNYPIRFDDNNMKIVIFDACKLIIQNHHKIDFLLNKIEKLVLNGCTFSNIVQITKTENLELDLRSDNKILNLTIADSNLASFHSSHNTINTLAISSSKLINFVSVEDSFDSILLMKNEINVFDFFSSYLVFDAIDNKLMLKFLLHNINIYRTLSNYLRLSLITIAKECIFGIQNYEIKKVIISRLNTSSDNVLFNSINVLDEFNLSNSNMSKVHFNTINLENASNVKIYETNVVDCVFNDIKWGDVSKIEANTDTFRQLKHANDKQSNYLTAHQFYSKEMEEYSKTIHKKNIEEKIVFFLGKYISNFSQSWLMPLAWIIIVGIIFYLMTFATIQSFFITTTLTLVVLIIFFPEQKWIHYDFSFYLYAVASFFMILFSILSLYSSITLDLFASFINPFGTFLKDGSNHHFIWLLHKLISSFLIYHFVVSLRRSTQR